MIPDERAIEKFQTKFLPITDDDLVKLEKAEAEIMETTVEVKEDEPVEEKSSDLHEEVIMEKLKYDHPPPYVMPSKKALCILLEAKRANKSIPSLVSRFSIDSRLQVKKKDDFSPDYLISAAIVSLPQDTKPSKMIKLFSTKYLYSRLSPIRMMPLRAIDESYIHSEDIDKRFDEEHQVPQKVSERTERKVLAKLPVIPYTEKPVSALIPFGTSIRTPVPPLKYLTCLDERKQKRMSSAERESAVGKKSFCDAEKLLFKIIFPNFDPSLQLPEERDVEQMDETKRKKRIVKMRDEEDKHSISEAIGFEVVNEDMEILRGKSCLTDRTRVESSRFKPCYFSAMLCILAKIAMDVNCFRDGTLDRVILLTDKINRRVGKLRHKDYEWFRDVSIFNVNFNVILKETIYADPESSPFDDLDTVIEKFLDKNRTGILVLENCAHAFWTADDRYYLFDPYPCDERGNANEEGYCCLMRFRDLKSMVGRIKQSAGQAVRKPFDLYTVCITHLEVKERKRKRGRKSQRHRIEKTEEPVRAVCTEDKRYAATPSTDSESSLIELAEWVTSDTGSDPRDDITIAGFTPVRHHEASIFEVVVLEDDITTPTLAPFKKLLRTSEGDCANQETTMQRKRTYERIFRNHTSFAIPIDLCVMAWSLIHDPISWSKRTIDALLEASADYAFDSVLASEDTSVNNMTDALLPELEIGNYTFRAVFAPLHYGTLYAVEGWNLAMTLEKIFETRIYTGAIIVCRYAHVGVTRKGRNYFAWWTVVGTKSLRIITSSNRAEFLKLIIKEVDEPREIEFIVRAVTVSYACKMDPDCSDVKGLHEPIAPMTSLAEIYRMEPVFHDVQALYRPIDLMAKPFFVLGTVSLSDRDSLVEPRAKRCYFVALLAVMIKRDIIQSPIPSMIDRVLEVAENLYRRFSEPKFHTEHILRNVPLMNRFFDLRDCASPLITLTRSPGKNDFYVQVKKHLKRHFKTYTSGVLHFTNCCYGFWFSRATRSYYYLDPYPCNAKGRRTSANGNASLCIFSFLCQMVRHMCLKQYEGTTGFFIHRLHVDSIDSPPCEKFQEDPMWVYLDYHWNFAHSTSSKSSEETKDNVKSDSSRSERRFWNRYVIEVTDLIYSVWGTIGAYDRRFGERAGRNRAGICVAILAMQHLCHPSRWSPAILDSAVIRGDSYYTESLSSAARKCSGPSNRFRLRTSLRMFPHLWTVDFSTSVCGVLYGDRDRLTLSATLRLAFEEARNVIIECNEITLAALAAKDAYYVADPCWIGPPLFPRDHGAIYVLRCSNINVLIYAITKMFNTNLRLDVRVTPLTLSFDRENFDMDLEFCVAKRILRKTARKAPGKTKASNITIPGAVVVPDESSYLRYERHLAKGVTIDLQQRYTLPTLRPENANNMIVSTKWHLNLGQACPSKKDPVERFPYAIDPFEAHQLQISVADLMAICDDYPKAIDFASDALSPGIMSLECTGTAKRSFIREESRTEFNERVAEMSSDFYKNYRHHLPKQKEDRVKKNSETQIEVKLNEMTIDVTVDTGKENKFQMETESEITDVQDVQ
ncbi:uncharacterized protein LOC116844835 [Odontomachus brunneus]|uniref:uncharacterized protein LOC116844835 n=1 Tax=Odontomachus brunneus TaxID=486640 RepID=UPI0013F1DF44|nr:uncharacterized protein LOC116844835 [Odontomachus brunneus]